MRIANEFITRWHILLDCSEKQIFESCDHDYECSVTENANVCTCRNNVDNGNMALCLCNNGYFEYKLSCIPGDVFALVLWMPF